MIKQFKGVLDSNWPIMATENKLVGTFLGMRRMEFFWISLKADSTLWRFNLFKPHTDLDKEWIEMQAWL